MQHIFMIKTVHVNCQHCVIRQIRGDIIKICKILSGKYDAAVLLESRWSRAIVDVFEDLYNNTTSAVEAVQRRDE